MDRFNFQRLVIPIDLTTSDAVVTGSFLVHPGDVIESISVVLQAHDTNGVADSGISLTAQADNGTVITGVGVSLPTDSQLLLIDDVRLPFTAASSVATTTSPATGIVSSFFTYLSMRHDLPIHLVCDSSTRDIQFQIDSPDYDVKGYVALHITRPEQRGSIA